MRPLERTLTEKDSVIGDDPDRKSPYMRETTDQRLAVQLLEFIELGPVNHARDDVADIERLAAISGDHAINLLPCKQRLRGVSPFESPPPPPLQCRNRSPGH